MERIKNLDSYQKLILALLAAMAVVFAGIYSVVTSRYGFLYHDEILIPSYSGETTVYSGKIDGKPAEFIVSASGTVSFRHGEKGYGPYTVTEDASAIPMDEPQAGRMKGIEVRNGEKVLFRGGYLNTGAEGQEFLLYDEEGWNPMIRITATMSDGTVVDGDGNIVDLMEPGAGTILRLVNGPRLVSKGQWFVYFIVLVYSVYIAAMVLFAEEMFRWKFVFLARNADRIEPSDWALAERKIGWAIGTVGALIFYMMGLR